MAASKVKRAAAPTNGFIALTLPVTRMICKFTFRSRYAAGTGGRLGAFGRLLWIANR